MSERILTPGAGGHTRVLHLNPQDGLPRRVRQLTQLGFFGADGLHHLPTVIHLPKMETLQGLPFFVLGTDQ